MSDTNPQLVVGGMSWRGWTSVSVKYSADEAARSFSFTITDSNGDADTLSQAWNFMPGTEVQVMEGGELMCHGYVDSMTPSYDENSHSVSVSGRSKSGDTIDSSAEHHSGEIRNKNLHQIAQELDKQGVGFSTDVGSLEKVPLFRVSPYETVFQALDRVASKQQLLLMGEADGSIKITKGGEKRVNAPLIEGHNIKAASSTFNDSKRHSEVRVKGQKGHGCHKNDLEIDEHAKDSGCKRHRPKHLPTEGDVDKGSAKKRAKHHRDRCKGESLCVTVKVQGWRDEDGKLYVPNTLIYVFSPMLKLDMDLLIKSVCCTTDGASSHTELSLVHPKALGSKAKSGSKTKKQYQWGDDDG